jgi:adenylate cyclase
MPAVRRLAAILVADVAGYSRLMGADEEGTHERLQAHRRELVDPKIGEHSGRVVKNTGDGVLAEFPSVVDAVRCAVELQRVMIDREAGMPEDRRIRFRIGINLGDVILEDDDIFGDGVNVAARLEALAEPGGICISRMVRDQIRDKLPYAFEDLSEQSVKNIARPVRVYALRPGAVGVATGPAVPAASPIPEPAIAPRMSIVVLPFANLGNDPDQQYFVDGITEDLTTDLSRIPGSFVIARNTAFTYQGKPVDARQIGRELGVRYILEGSVRRTANQVRVNVQLIDAESGAHVWADRFDTDCANLAGVQDEIIGRLARSLNVELAKDVGLRIERERMADPDALDLVMRGRAVMNRPVSAARYEEALPLLEQALEIDPRSVDAKLFVASALAGRAADGWSSSRQQDLARAEKLLLEVLEVDPNSLQARSKMGQVLREQGRLAEAKIELEMAIALDGNSVKALRWLANTLTWLGEPEAGIPHLEKAIRLGPRDPDVANNYQALGVCHLLIGHVDQAIDLLRRARAANPRWGPIPLWLAGALGLKGELDEARAALAEAIKLRPEINSLAQARALYAGSPRYWALREKTLNVGLRRAGFPDE